MPETTGISPVLAKEHRRRKLKREHDKFWILQEPPLGERLQILLQHLVDELALV